MADVKWIKLAADIFNNRKIRQIESLPEGDAIVVVWVKLLCLAGKINDKGCIYLTETIPFTDQMLATELNRPIATIQLALQTFLQFGMIEFVDDVICISNWEKYQNIDRLAEIREYNRLAKRRSREKQKLLGNVNDMSMTGQQSHDTDKEEDKDIDKNKSKNIDYDSIKEAFNSICISLPSIKTLSEARKKAIRARLNVYSQEDIIEAFRKAEASDFLKGKNNRNWQANFDWIIKDANIAKILDGNYDGKETVRTSTNMNDLDELF